MEKGVSEYLQKQFGLDEKVIKVAESVEKDIKGAFLEIERVREINQYKVISAMQKNKLSDTHFAGTTGYGYDDRGRDVLDLVYKDVFGGEDALVRHNFVNGTQAIAVCLYGNLRPGDELLSITGKPYDTLEEVIGIRGEGEGSLKDFGISFKQLDLTKDGKIDEDAFGEVISEKTKIVYIQRSRGYSFRPSISISDMAHAILRVREVKPDVLVLVDNCYGEFVEEREPLAVGADLIAGSLIKNPGGGLALSGGYVAGKKLYVKRSAYRLTTPGIGKKVGATLGQNRAMFQGLFMAPHVVGESLKGAVFCAAIMKKLGYLSAPLAEDTRTDIIQAIRFDRPELLIAFCQGIQKGSPVDAFVSPEPWEMPGYDSPVIMAAGGFVQGASIELSADAPIKPPYIAYLQGGLVYEHVKLGVLSAIQTMVDRNLVFL